MTKADRIDEISPDMKVELLARLKNVVPEVFSDGLLNLDRLAELGRPTEVRNWSYGGDPVAT